MKLKRFDTLNEAKKEKVTINQGSEYADYLVENDKERKFADVFQWFPGDPITIAEAEIDMKDEYNGKISIELSNGDLIEYKCIESTYSRFDHEPTRQTGGPDAKVTLYLNNKKIGGDEIWDKYNGSGNSWLEAVMNFYKDYKGKEYSIDESFIEKETGMEFPTRNENALRNKLDAAILQYLKYQNKIDLDFMKSDRMKLIGDDKYNELYHYMIDALKNHK